MSYCIDSTTIGSNVPSSCVSEQKFQLSIGQSCLHQSHSGSNFQNSVQTSFQARIHLNQFRHTSIRKNTHPFTHPTPNKLSNVRTGGVCKFKRRESSIFSAKAHQSTWRDIQYHQNSLKHSEYIWIIQNCEKLEEKFVCGKKSHTLDKIHEMLRKRKWFKAEQLLLAYLIPVFAHQNIFDLRNMSNNILVSSTEEKYHYDVDNVLELMIIQKVLNQQKKGQHNRMTIGTIETNEAKVSNETYSQSFNNMLYSLMEQKQYKRVIEYVEKWLIRNPVSVFARFERIECWKMMKNLDHVFCETVLCFDVCYLPRHFAKCYRNFGFYYIEKRELEKAVACFAKSLLYEVNICVMQELVHIEHFWINTIPKNQVKRISQILEKIRLLKSIIVDYVVSNRLFKITAEFLDLLSEKHIDAMCDDNSQSPVLSNYSQIIDGIIKDKEYFVGYRNHMYQYHSKDQQKKHLNRLPIIEYSKELITWIQTTLEQCTQTLDGQVLKVPLCTNSIIVECYQKLLDTQKWRQGSVFGNLTKYEQLSHILDKLEPSATGQQLNQEYKSLHENENLPMNTLLNPHSFSNVHPEPNKQMQDVIIENKLNPIWNEKNFFCEIQLEYNLNVLKNC